MTELPRSRLLADVGATNVRFACQPHAGGPLNDVQAYRTADFTGLEQAVRHYLREQGCATPAWCAIGIATAVTGDQVQMTNHPWSFSTAALQQALGFERLVVLNDFTALALALPDLPADALRQVGGGAVIASAAKALIGPGSGLGVSGLLPSTGIEQWVPIQGEGGHVSLAPDDDREVQVIRWLQAHFGHASAERALCGSGLVMLRRALCALDGQADEADQTPDLITAHALAGSDAKSVQAVDLFCALLGSVAGDLALTLGARGGVYIGGGIVPRLGEAFARSRFRSRFEAKGRFKPYLAAIPVFVISAGAAPALLGAGRAL